MHGAIQEVNKSIFHHLPNYLIKQQDFFRCLHSLISVELKEFLTVMQTRDAVEGLLICLEFSHLSSCLDEVVKWEQNFILLVQHKYWNPSTTKSRDSYVKISLLTDIRNRGIFSMMVRTIIERHDVYGKQ